MAKHCTKCDKEYKDTFDHCTVCGTKLKTKPIIDFCGSCGTKITEDTNFCKKCGTTLEDFKEEPEKVEEQKPEPKPEIFQEAPKAEAKVAIEHKSGEGVGSGLKFGAGCIFGIVIAILLIIVAFVLLITGALGAIF